MKVEVFRRYYDPMEANIVLSKLQANEINCVITNENATTLLWPLSIAHGGINLMLDKKDFDKAGLILEDEPIIVEEIESTGSRCPKCNSNNIAFGVQSKERINWIQLLFSFLIAGPAPIIRQAHHCFNCGNNFEKE